MNATTSRASLLTCFTLSLAALSSAQTSSLPTQDAIRDAFNVSEWSLQRLALPSELSPQMTIQVRIEGQLLDLQLAQHNLRAPDFQLLVVGADGLPIETPAAPARTFRGPVAQMPGALAVASLLDGGLQAAIHVDGAMRWVIQPLTELDPSADPSLHIVFDAHDMLGGDWSCGVSTPHVQPTTGGGAFFGTGLALAEIAFDSDVEFFQLNGSSVNNTVNDIELIMNNMAAIYESDVQITYWMTAAVVRIAEPDPYSSTDSSVLLNNLGSQMTGPLSFLKRDMAHLMTGKNVDGSIIGLASVGAVCNAASGFGMSQSRFTNNLVNRTALTAHECGHNWGSQHCDGQAGACRIMCSGLGGCAPDVTRFGPFAIGQILSFKATLSCVPELANPLTVPFLDTITGNINIDNWPTRQGTGSNSNGVNEPSGARSLNLHAENSDDLADDWIRSNYFLLSGLSGLSLSYWSEHRGVEAGEELVLEFRNAAGNWIELDRLTSNGVDENNYVLQSVSLPAGAYHDEFQFQFRAEVSDATDDWFIDDVTIDNGCSAPANYCIGAANSFSAFGAFMSSTGSTSVSANNLTLIAGDAIPGQFGIFYFGPLQAQAPFGEGFRCVAGSTKRMPLQTANGSGLATRVVDLNNLPSGASIQAGDTVNFQFWFRDPAGGGTGFNLSDGLNTVWCP